MTRKLNIDIVTHYWPPIGGPGSKRMQTWARGFAAAGHHVRVWTPPGRPGDAFYDATLGEPTGVTTVRVPFLDLSRPFRHASTQAATDFGRAAGPGRLGSLTRSLGRFIRDQLTLPDYRRLWNPRVTTNLLRINPPPDVIITTSPYESTHLVGRAVQKRTGAFWIADFRDLWGETTLGKYQRTPLHDLYNRHLESDVLARANLVTVFHNIGAQMLLARGTRNLDAKMLAIHNGVDRAHIDAATPPSSKTASPQPLKVVHAGTIWSFRWPDGFLTGWQAFKDNAPRDAQLHLYGRIEPEVLATLDAHRQATPNCGIVIHGSVASDMIRRHLAEADALLILASGAVDTVTSKIFEAIAAQRPLLYFGHPQSGGAQLLRQLGATAAPSHGFDATATTAHWQQFGHAVQAGDLSAYIPRLDREIIENERQVERLLDALAARHHASRP